MASGTNDADTQRLHEQTALETRPPNIVLRTLRRAPLTIAFALALIIAGVVSGSLWSPATEQPWFDQVGTGLPAFADGRWWTLFSALFFVIHPALYLALLPLVIGGLGWAEWRFGTLRAGAIFIVGHVFGVTVTAGILAALAQTGWPWASNLAQLYDVGPSCGALAALIFALSTLPSPWRLRARLAVGLSIGISVLYLGQLHDLEHAVTMTAALIATGWLPGFRHPAGRPSSREWRLLALAALIAIGAIQIIDLVVPFDGPLGQNHPTASLIDVAIDVIVIALIANGVRRGYRFAWWCAVILATFNLVTAALGFALIPLLIEAGLIASPLEPAALLLAPALLWAALLVLLVIGRGSFAVSLRKRRRDLALETLSEGDALERLRAFGGGTISWMTMWEGNRRVATGSGMLAYQNHADVAILLGDPIVHADDADQALEAFAHEAQQAGLIPCAFSTSDATAKAKPDGWRSVVVAEDTIVDLPELEFTGKPWAAVRTAINRAVREGVEFQMVRLAEQPFSVLAQVRAISEQWAGDKGLPEMRFTLGRVDEALDPEVYVGIAVDADGNLHGVTSWLPVYRNGAIVGWTLDLMRRREGGFGPVMEFLIASSAKWFAEEGFDFVSLSGAPLVRTHDTDSGAVGQVLDRIAHLIEPLYGFSSLHRFKQKFNPRAEPLHLLYRDEGDLPRIGIAITRAYLPDASLRDLLSSASGAASAERGAQ